MTNVERVKPELKNKGLLIDWCRLNNGEPLPLKKVNKVSFRQQLITTAICLQQNFN